MSATSGCEDRMNDSLQQVHSWKCSQTTGRRRFFSRALTTSATPLLSRPRYAAIQVQNLTKSRRLTPRARISSQIVGPPAGGGGIGTFMGVLGGTTVRLRSRTAQLLGGKLARESAHFLVC